LRLIETLPSAPRAGQLPASSSRAVVRTPTRGIALATPVVVLPRQSTGNGPFLAQYIAQDAERRTERQPNPTLWKQRDAAYRSAASPAPTTELNIEV
jgi:hypothetical protein